jgi:hypothetical protein
MINYMFIDQVDVLVFLVGGRVHDPLGANVTKLFIFVAEMN